MIIRLSRNLLSSLYMQKSKLPERAMANANNHFYYLLLADG